MSTAGGLPDLVTPRLRARPLGVGDVDAATALYTDPEVNRYIPAAAQDDEAARAQVWRRLTVRAPAGMGYWVLDDGDGVFGLVKLLPSNELPDGLAEVGWRLARSHWGRGLAVEAARALLAHGFGTLGLPAMWALVHEENAASLALCRRLGFREVGTGPHDRTDQRVLVALAGAAGALHHVELWVPDLARAEASLGWLLAELGWREDNRWPEGVCLRRGRTHLVLCASADRSAATHDRRRPGRNHLALHVADAVRMDELTAAAVARGWTLLFPERHPHAGGDHQHAAYLADPDGFEVELVAMTTGGDRPV